MKNVLVTGGAGFIGSNFVHVALERTDWNIINLDALTYAGNLENLSAVADNPRYRFVKGDIRDRELVASLFADYDIDGVVHFAAESHVDRSIEDPDVFLSTNVHGTQVLLDSALHAWRDEPDNKHCRSYRPGAKFVHVSTDEVYGTLTPDAPRFTEQNPLAPNSPYSASKASSDLYVRAYRETFGLPVNITRCSNNYGPYQFPEKLIPLMINNALADKELPVYGDGMQIRDWLYVEDHCTGILAVAERGFEGQVYNIGGNNEKANINIVRIILQALGKPESLIKHVADRPGHDRRYAIDNSKITNELGWAPEHTFEEGIQKTIQWYLDNADWVANVTSGSYRDYYEKMYQG